MEKMMMNTKMVIMMTIRLIKMNQLMTDIMVHTPKMKWDIVTMTLIQSSMVIQMLIGILINSEEYKWPNLIKKDSVNMVLNAVQNGWEENHSYRT